MPITVMAMRSMSAEPCACSSVRGRAPSSSRTRSFLSAAVISTTRRSSRQRKCSARSSPHSMRDTLVIARTGAVAVEGFERAIARAELYREAGADALFVEAPKTRAELLRIPPALRGVPLMANMVEGGKTPPLPAADLEALGFSLVIFPGGIVRALAHMASEYYASLAAHGTSEPFRARMLDFEGLNDVIGTSELLAFGKQYESPALPSESRKGSGS